MEENHSCFWKGMGTNFPSSSHKMGFAAFSNAMGYCWEDLCISFVKQAIRWESDGREPRILSEKFGYQFPRFSLICGFSHSMRY